MLVTHATRFGERVEPDERPVLIAWRKFYPILAEDGFLDMEQRLNDVIRETAAEHQVLLVDAAHLMPHGPRYFAEFVHFTDAGARQMAILIADHLQPALAGLATKSPRPFVSTGAGVGTPPHRYRASSPECVEESPRVR